MDLTLERPHQTRWTTSERIDSLAGDMEAIQKMLTNLSQELKSGLSSVETKLESTQASVDATVSSIRMLDAWKSEINTQVSDLSASMAELRKHVDRVAVGVGLSALGQPPQQTPGAAVPPANPANLNSAVVQGENSGLLGLCQQHDHRGQTGKQLALPLSSPVAGTDRDHSSMAMVPVPESHVVVVSTDVSAPPKPPQTDFPKFEGDNPRLWQKAAEKYFHLFAVDPSYRVEYATMHFAGNAALWIQSVENRLHEFTWGELCSVLHKRFDRGSTSYSTDKRLNSSRQDQSLIT